MNAVAEQEKIVAVKNSSGQQIFPPQKSLDKKGFDPKRKKDKIGVSTRTRKGNMSDPREKEIPIEAIEPYVPAEKVYALADPEATQRVLNGEYLYLNSAAVQQDNWQKYIDRIRGVKQRRKGETDPPGNISMRKFYLQTGISNSTLRGLSLKLSDPDKTPTEIVIKLARAGGITEYELRQYISYSTFQLPGQLPRTASPINTLASPGFDIESYLYSSPLSGLVNILKIVSDLISKKIGDSMLSTQDESFLSEANNYLLDLLDDFQTERGLSDEEFNDLKRIYKISSEEINAIEKDERPSLKLVGNIARMTGKSIDELMEIVNKSYPS